MNPFRLRQCEPIGSNKIKNEARLKINLHRLIVLALNADQKWSKDYDDSAINFIIS